MKHYPRFYKCSHIVFRMVIISEMVFFRMSGKCFLDGSGYMKTLGTLGDFVCEILTKFILSFILCIPI